MVRVSVGRRPRVWVSARWVPPRRLRGNASAIPAPSFFPPYRITYWELGGTYQWRLAPVPALRPPTVWAYLRSTVSCQLPRNWLGVLRWTWPTEAVSVAF